MAKKKESNKKIEKKIIIWISSIFISLLIIIIAIFIGIKFLSKDEEPTININNNRDENIIYNDNEDVVSDKVLGDVTITNIECSFDGFRSLLTYTITNNGNNSIILNNYEIIVKDKDDNVLAIMIPGDTNELKAKESLDTGNVIDIDLSNATSIKLRLSK